MSSWDSELEARLRAYYELPVRENGRSHAPHAVATPAGAGFVTEVAGRVVLTTPANTVSVADDLPEAMRERWEKASSANPYFMWLQGRFVEAERANRNGAFWSTEDLAHGEMSVRHGPLNWLHDARQVIGTLADNKLITPTAVTMPVQAALETGAATWTVAPVTTTTTAIQWNQIGNGSLQLASTPMVAKPYIAAVAAVWKWIYPDQAKAVQIASDAGQLWYSMECVAREMACHTDGDRQGCGKSFPYLQAMTQPEQVCEHIRTKSSARRMVDPSFLGGAVIVPPVRPGWPGASAEVMRQAAALAEQVAPADAQASDWEHLMAGVLRFAETR